MYSGMPPGYLMRANWNFVAAFAVDGRTSAGESAPNMYHVNGSETAMPRHAAPTANHFRGRNCKRLPFPTIMCPATTEHLSFHTVPRMSEVNLKSEFADTKPSTNVQHPTAILLFFGT